MLIAIEQNGCMWHKNLHLLDFVSVLVGEKADSRESVRVFCNGFSYFFELEKAVYIKGFVSA